MLSRCRLLAKLLLILFCLSGCNPDKSTLQQRLTVGVVSYDAGARSVEKYEGFKDYLAEQADTIVELEPSFNELRAVEQIQRQAWSIVFAPPGLAAIAIGTEHYIPIFAM